MPLFTGFRFGFGVNAAGGGPSYDDSGPLQASGGNAEYTYGSKKIHVFTASGSLTCTSGSSTCEVFVVGGGGAGANGACGGGGGGGVRNLTTPFSIGPDLEYTITVGGGGGNPDATLSNNGYNGGNSAIEPVPAPGSNSVFATGGGHGKYETGPSDPGGGSAGGGHGWDGPGGEAAVSPDGLSPTTQGYDGGAGNGWSNGGGGGGGGGAVGAGGAGKTGAEGGIGVKIPTTFQDPTNPYGAAGNPTEPKWWFAGGGAGGGWSPTGGGASDGGSNPGNPNGPWAGSGDGTGNASANAPLGEGAGWPGTANTGGGAGGGSSHTPSPGGAGGSGIVFIAYPT